MQSLKPLSLLFILCIFLTPIQSTAQELTTVILVRHAEKIDDGTKDPPLSKEGEGRAQELVTLFNDADITAIYSTPYKRTEQTVALLAKEKGLDITTYDPFDQTFVDSLLASEKGGTVLISGHSNTTPYIANLLISEKRFAQFEESDYGNILIIAVAEKGRGKVVHLRY